MANEAQIYSNLAITSGELQYQSLPAYFNADVAGSKGPAPGAFLADTTGTKVDLSELTTPGLCRIVNLDPTNYVTVGLYDPDTTTFYPLMELLPGESYVFRFSRDVGLSYGTGTGTNDSDAEVHVRGNVAACNVSVEAFEV